MQNMANMYLEEQFSRHILKCHNWQSRGLMCNHIPGVLLGAVRYSEGLLFRTHKFCIPGGSLIRK